MSCEPLIPVGSSIGRRSRCDAHGRVATPKSTFRHEALFYEDGDHGFLDGTLELVRRALERDAGVLVTVGGERAAALHEALGADAQQVRFVDMHRLGRNPARIIPVWHEFAAEHASGCEGAALAIGEPVWRGRGAAELEECARHEALVNLAFDDGPGWHLLCPYDLDTLDDAVIEAARLAHPLLTRGAQHHVNERYTCAPTHARPFAGELPAPRAPVSELVFALDGLAQVRRTVSGWAGKHALEQERVEELMLAVDELAANSIRYGGGGGTLRYWREDALLMCEVRDTGWLQAPLVGRMRPAGDARGGRGIWLANQLCDLVQIRSSHAGSVVRVHKSLD